MFRKTSSPPPGASWPGEFAALDSAGTHRTFKADDTIFFEGDPADFLYLIVSGSAKVYRACYDGRPRILNIIGPGEVCGVSAVIDGKPRSNSVTTLEPTEVLAVSRDDFRRIANSQPDVWRKLLEVMLERARATDAAVLDLTFRNVPYRLLATLIRLSDSHAEHRSDGIWIKACVTAADLACMVGTSPKAVFRVLDQFQEAGIIERKGERLRIHDKERLNKALEYVPDWT